MVEEKERSRAQNIEGSNTDMDGRANWEGGRTFVHGQQDG